MIDSIFSFRHKSIVDSGDLKRLNIERNHPLLLVTRTSFDLQDRPVEFRISRINTGNHVYRADLR